MKPLPRAELARRLVLAAVHAREALRDEVVAASVALAACRVPNRKAWDRFHAACAALVKGGAE